MTPNLLFSMGPDNTWCMVYTETMMERTQLYLSQELKKDLYLLAEREDKNISEVARELLEKGLKTLKRKANPAGALLRMAKEAEKITSTSPGDLSTRHDYYLYGPGSPKWRKLYRRKKK